MSEPVGLGNPFAHLSSTPPIHFRRKRKIEAARLERIRPVPNQGRQASVTTVSSSGSNHNDMSELQNRFHISIEDLPTELLETIFLRSLNLNLPKASLQLGRKLSGFHVRREVFHWLCSTPDATKSFWSTHVDEQRVSEQTSLLRQKWLTLDFLRQCVPDYLTGILLREMTLRRLHWLDSGSPLVTPRLKPTIKTWVVSLLRDSPQCFAQRKNFEVRTWVDYAADPSSREARWVVLTLDLDQVCMNLKITPGKQGPDPTKHVFDRGLVAGRDRQIRHKSRMLWLSPRTQLPARLLRGPWTDAKIDLLVVMLHAKASIDRVNTTAGETAEAGLWDALREGNARAVHVLLAERYSINGGVGITAKPEHLIWALEKKCSKTILFSLLYAPLSEIDLHSMDFAEVLVRLEMQGREEAMWLKELRDLWLQPHPASESQFAV